MSRRNRETPGRAGPEKSPSRDPIFDVETVASATECTGLLPAQIQTEEQGENVAALQCIHRICPRFVDGNDED